MSNDLNRSIAEMVMGIRTGHRCGDAAGPTEEGFRECPCSSHAYRYMGMQCIHDKGNVHFPDYLNDPVAVFGPGGVVEKMNTKGYSLSLDVFSKKGESARACFYPKESIKYLFTAYWDDSITQAVCLAALAALEG